MLSKSMLKQHSNKILYEQKFVKHAHFNFHSFKQCGNVNLSYLKIVWKVYVLSIVTFYHLILWHEVKFCLIRCYCNLQNKNTTINKRHTENNLHNSNFKSCPIQHVIFPAGSTASYCDNFISPANVTAWQATFHILYITSDVVLPTTKNAIKIIHWKRYKCNKSMKFATE